MFRKLNIKTTQHLAHRLKVPLGLLERIRDEKDKHYHPKPRATKPGKEPRPIVLLSTMAKETLRTLNKLLLGDLGHPDYMHGGMRGKTILSNARPHSGADFVLKLDLKKFFPSISPEMVKNALIKHAGFSNEVAQLVTELATHENRLITGSPSSTVIASLVIREGTERIYGLVKQRKGQMSVFVDDLTISGGPHLRKIEAACIEYLEATGVQVHERKRIRVSGPTAEKVVTGVNVAHGIDASSGYKNGIRLLCENMDRRSKNGTVLSDDERQSLAGKLNYLGLLNLGMARSYKRRYSHLLP